MKDLSDGTLTEFVCPPGKWLGTSPNTPRGASAQNAPGTQAIHLMPVCVCVGGGGHTPHADVWLVGGVRDAGHTPLAGVWGGGGKGCRPYTSCHVLCGEGGMPIIHLCRCVCVCVCVCVVCGGGASITLGIMPVSVP